MKKINDTNINTPEYWDSHQTALDFGLRQQKYLDLALNRGRIIELGCGLSPFINEATKYFKEVWGLDYSKKTINELKRKHPHIKYICANATRTPFKDNFFDVVVAGEIIEHLENPLSLIREMKRICKHGGKIIISTPVLEFKDPEHLWQFYAHDFKLLGFKTDIVHSERFKGRSYIFAHKIKQ